LLVRCVSFEHLDNLPEATAWRLYTRNVGSIAVLSFLCSLWYFDTLVGYVAGFWMPSQGAGATAEREAEDELTLVGATSLEAIGGFSLSPIFTVDDLRVSCLGLVDID
jgi:hypothetical protein